MTDDKKKKEALEKYPLPAPKKKYLQPIMNFWKNSGRKKKLN